MNVVESHILKCLEKCSPIIYIGKSDMISTFLILEVEVMTSGVGCELTQEHSDRSVCIYVSQGARNISAILKNFSTHGEW